MSVCRARRVLSPLVSLVLASLVLAGCSADQDEPAAKASPTPITRLNTAAVQLPRIDFCSLVPTGAVKDAVGASVEKPRTWGNGDEEPVLPGGAEDVVHEVGCEWRAGSSAARAWVFAPPIDRAAARRVIAAGGRDPGCRAVQGPEFGAPSYTRVCGDPPTRVRHAGLFGQTWLTCEVERAGPRPGALRARADAWCVEVVNTLNTRR